MYQINRSSTVLAEVILLAFGTTAWADNMPVSENFEGYEPGQLVYSHANDHANKGTGFEYQWLVDTEAVRPNLTIVEKSMDFSGSGFSIVGGNKAMHYEGSGTYDVARRRFNKQDNGDVWFSFLIQTDTDTAETPASDTDFVQVLFQKYNYPPLSDANSLSALLHTAGNTSGGHDFQARAGNYLYRDNSQINNQPGTTHFIVGRLHEETTPGSYDRIDLYVDPTTVTQPASVDASKIHAGMGIGDISMIRPRFGPLDEANDGVWLDEFRLGRTYQDVLALYENDVRGQTSYGTAVAYWRFGDYDNSTTNYDTMGGLAAVAVNDAYLTANGPRPSDGFGQFESNNSAAYFFGSNDYFEVADPGDNSALDFQKGEEITIEAWIQAAGSPMGQYDYIVSKGSNGGDGSRRNFGLRLGTTDSGNPDEAKISFRYTDKDDQLHLWYSTDTVPGDYGWHKIALSYTFGEGDTIVGYIDGMPTLGAWVIGDGYGTPLPDNGALWIGSGVNGDSNVSWYGKIDELAIYSRIPEPSTLVLLAFGGLALLLGRTRTRRRT